MQHLRGLTDISTCSHSAFKSSSLFMWEQASSLDSSSSLIYFTWSAFPLNTASLEHLVYYALRESIPMAAISMQMSSLRLVMYTLVL